MERPTFVPSSLRGDEPLDYLWDDWNVEQAEEPVDSELEQRLLNISLRAVVAFTEASAEWILYRYEHLLTDPMARLYLDAAYCGAINEQYFSLTWEDYLADSEWKGPVRGVVSTAMTRVMYAIQQCYEYENPELRAAWIAKLASHVVPVRSEYAKWMAEVVEQFDRLFPRDKLDPLGDVVPRIACDPKTRWNLEELESIVNAELSAIRHDRNPFLAKPTDLIAHGVTSPYVFNLNEDRIIRRELT
jgi:hypothetical protein